MPKNVENDQLLIIKIDGLHCHKCEQTITRALLTEPGVHEVEVDFLSGQASVLFDERQVEVPKLLAQIDSAGYHAAGFSRSGGL